jgi:hypothetical protein
MFITTFLASFRAGLAPEFAKSDMSEKFAFAKIQFGYEKRRI